MLRDRETDDGTQLESTPSRSQQTHRRWNCNFPAKTSSGLTGRILTWRTHESDFQKLTYGTQRQLAVRHGKRLARMRGQGRRQHQRQSEAVETESWLADTMATPLCDKHPLYPTGFPFFPRMSFWRLYGENVLSEGRIREVCASVQAAQPHTVSCVVAVCGWVSCFILSALAAACISSRTCVVRISAAVFSETYNTLQGYWYTMLHSPVALPVIYSTCCRVIQNPIWRTDDLGPMPADQPRGPGVSPSVICVFGSPTER